MIMLYLAEACRMYIGFLLLYAALTKATGFDQFSYNLNESFQVPTRWCGFMAAVIISLEGVLAAIILYPNTLTFYAMVLAMLLFIIFTIVIAIKLWQNKLIRCNCFGSTDAEISYLDIARNLIFILAAMVYIFEQGVFNPGGKETLLLGLLAINAGLVSVHIMEISLVARDPKKG